MRPAPPYLPRWIQTVAWLIWASTTVVLGAHTFQMGYDVDDHDVFDAVAGVAAFVAVPPLLIAMIKVDQRIPDRSLPWLLRFGLTGIYTAYGVLAVASYSDRHDPHAAVHGIAVAIMAAADACIMATVLCGHPRTLRANSGQSSTAVGLAAENTNHAS